MAVDLQRDLDWHRARAGEVLLVWGGVGGRGGGAVAVLVVSAVLEAAGGAGVDGDGEGRGAGVRERAVAESMCVVRGVWGEERVVGAGGAGEESRGAAVVV